MNGEKYQVGDKVACLPGFDHSSNSSVGGGAGYTEGYVGVVIKVTCESSPSDEIVYWFKDVYKDYGIRGRALKLWRPEVINNYEIY